MMVLACCSVNLYTLTIQVLCHTRLKPCYIADDLLLDFYHLTNICSFCPQESCYLIPQSSMQT